MYAPQHVENNKFLKYAVVLSVYAVRIRVHAGNEYALIKALVPLDTKNAKNP